MDYITSILLGLTVLGLGYLIYSKINEKKNIHEGEIKQKLLNQLKSEFPEEYTKILGHENLLEIKDRLFNLEKKKLEIDLNQVKQDYVAEVAEKKRLNESLTFMKEQIGIKEKTIEGLNTALDNKKELKELHDEAMKEVRIERDENNQIVSKHENFLEKLTGNYQFQGDFGEDVLKNILRGAQLEEDRDYTFNKKQITSDAYREDKQIRPDCILNLVERSYVIDSKVSLVDWKKFVEADEEDKNQHLKNHIKSVNDHLYDEKKGLINKDYTKIYGLNSLQNVIVFFPSDNLLGFTLENDKSLFSSALENNFILAGPRTLMSMIKVLEQIRSEKKQIEGMKKMQSSATNIFEKYVGLKDAVRQTLTTYRTHGKKLHEVMIKSWGHQGLEKEIKKLKDKHGVISQKKVEDIKTENTDIYNIPDPDEDDKIINLKKE